MTIRLETFCQCIYWYEESIRSDIRLFKNKDNKNTWWENWLLNKVSLWSEDMRTGEEIFNQDNLEKLESFTKE